MDVESTESTGPQQWCVVYDSNTQAIIQVHTYIGNSNDKPLGRKALEKKALNCGVNYPKSELAIAHPKKGLKLRDEFYPLIDDGEIILKPVSELIEAAKKKKNR